MKFSNRLRSFAALACAVMLVLPPVEARTKKGDKFFKLAQKAESEKDLDGALNYYDQALATDPNDAEYLQADQRIHSAAGQAHLTAGKNLLKEQKLDDALLQFQKAFLADPSSQVSLQQIRDVTAMIKEREKAPAGTPILTPAERAREAIQKRIEALEGPPVLRPITNEISSLKMNNQPARVLYESVGKLAGINVLFDPQGIEGTTGGRNFNLDLNNVTLEEALNYVALITHTFWKPISRNAIFITQESEPKRQEYQDEVVKVFYIQNAATTNEFNEIFNGVRTGAKLTTGIFSVPGQNAIIVRGTTDQVALAERLVHDLDRAKAEVVIDVIVMEVNKTKITTLGAQLLGQGGLSVPLNFTPRSGSGVSTTTGSTTTGTTSTGTTTTGTTTSTTTGTTTSTTTGTSTGSTTGSSSQVTLARLAHLSTSDFSTTLPSTIIQALLSDNSSRVLQRPQLRATDGGKASLKIGEKIPYVSGSLNSAVATPGSVPYATTQFQQVDVGTNIDLQPHVNGPEDISMHIKVEISNVLQQISIAGIDEPEIGQQVDEADIRMKDGEVSLLGGLSDRENSLSLDGVPGFTNIPLLGYLFGSRKRTDTHNEILLALIPHILRAPDMSIAGEEGVAAGSERITRVRRASEPTTANTTTPPAAASPNAVPGRTPQTSTPNQRQQYPAINQPPVQIPPRNQQPPSANPPPNANQPPPKPNS